MLLRYVGGCVLAALLLPAAAGAQVYNVPTPAPTVSAVGRGWFEAREPILYAGDRYYPAGARYHFDPNIMVPAGTYDGIPIYVDTSVEAYSQILVPIGRGLVQPYERRRAGAIAGTTGSHAPGFPVEVYAWERGDESAQWPSRPAPSSPENWEQRPEPSDRQPSWPAGDRRSQDLLEPPGRIESVRAPEDNRGIWIVYEGARWNIAGKAVAFDESRFSKIGQYHDFPVYAARGSEEIYIPAASGMLAVYAKDAK